MPSYRFCLEGDDATTRELDLPDASAIRLVAQTAARRMACRELEEGQLVLSRNLLVFDAGNTEVARYPLSDFIAVG